MSLIKVKVPGSVMLMGEHSVLFGEKAIACAVNKYIYVELSALDKPVLHIDSALAQYESPLVELVNDERLSFVITAVQSFLPVLTQKLSQKQSQQLPQQPELGIHLKITSEFSHTVGLGSSAAVTAGVVAALSAYTRSSVEKHELFNKALAVVHKVQDGRGSGTDLVASIYGSLVSYTVAPCSIKAIPVVPDISLFYTGYKTTTPEVLKRVEASTEHTPEIYSDLYRLMGRVTSSVEIAFENQDWPLAGLLMNQYHGLMDALGVSDSALSDLVYQLRQKSNVYGAKISGSGLGDCVITLGNVEQVNGPYELIPVSVSKEGVCIEHL